LDVLYCINRLYINPLGKSQDIASQFSVTGGSSVVKVSIPNRSQPTSQPQDHQILHRGVREANVLLFSLSLFQRLFCLLAAFIRSYQHQKIRNTNVGYTSRHPRLAFPYPHPIPPATLGRIHPRRQGTWSFHSDRRILKPFLHVRCQRSPGAIVGS
jgi:hypothetical protein